MGRLTPEEKEWKKLLKKEEEYLNKRKEKKESAFSSCTSKLDAHQKNCL